MKTQGKMIYNFEEHGLYYEKNFSGVPYFSLTINTLELLFDLSNGRLLWVSGYLPLVQAMRKNIPMLRHSERDFFLENIGQEGFRRATAYNIFEVMPLTKKYFQDVAIKLDPLKGIIQLGAEIELHEEVFSVDKNIFYAVDSDGTLKSLCLVPDEFLNAELEQEVGDLTQ